MIPETSATGAGVALSDGGSPRDVAGGWIAELSSYEKEYASWTTRCRKITKVYRDDRAQGTSTQSNRKYALLWSNVETIKPAVYSRPPKPVVTRRFKDRDPVSKTSSMVLERALDFTVDCYSLDDRLREVRQDYLLYGRGQMWARYEPTFREVEPEVAAEQAGETGEGGEQGADLTEELEYEKVCHDYVHWEDFFHSVSRTWDEVWWVARRTFQTRAQLIEKFGEEIGKVVPLDWGPKKNDSTEQRERTHKAAVYEIWSKRDRKVFFISRAYGEAPLAVKEPFYRLKKFFPCPRPCYATLTNEKLVPVPDYVFYQDQAEEIDDLTARIGKLTDALKLVGIYAGEQQAMLSQMLSPQVDMKMIPVENWAMVTDKKGVAGMVDWFPVAQVSTVLQGCIELRSQLIQDVYQITGISDIVRGATDPNETATAQQIKGQWGGLRIRDRQQEIQRFARDVIEIDGEIIAQQFSPETLASMTDMDLPSGADKAQAQQVVAQVEQQRKAIEIAAQQAQAQGLDASQLPQPPDVPEDVARTAEAVSWDDVVGLLRNNELRDFKIDVETDSTIQVDENAEKEARTELLGTVGNAIKEIAVLPPQLMPLMGQLLLFTIRSFRAGTAVEDQIEETIDQMTEAAKQPQQPAPDPVQMKAESDIKAKSALTEADIQNSAKKADAEIQIMRAKALEEINIGRARAQGEAETKSAAAAPVAREAPLAAPSAPSVVNLNIPPQEPPVVNVAIPPTPGRKTVVIQRGPSGEIVGADVVEAGAMQ